MQKEVLQIENLSIGYGKRKRVKFVCEGLSAKMNAGELVCLLGENGTGKSTLIRTLCGFQPALHGNAFLNGKELSSLSEKELALIVSVVLTDRVIVPNATVKEIVGLGRSPYTGMMGKLNTEDCQFVDEAIAKCGIQHKKNERLSNLSDGERQKVFIAKALAQNTPIIILDEPTAFLDMPARVEIIQLLRSIASSSGKSVLMSTHDLDLALQMADKLWLLSKNGKLQVGSPEDLLMNNSFQSLFKNKGIEFDNRTGLFKVEYQHNIILPVKGRGFEYVLLRRAFARKGIKLSPAKEETGTWIEIDKGNDLVFKFHKEGEVVTSETMIERFVTSTLTSLN